MKARLLSRAENILCDNIMFVDVSDDSKIAWKPTNRSPPQLVSLLAVWNVRARYQVLSVLMVHAIDAIQNTQYLDTWLLYRVEKSEFTHKNNNMIHEILTCLSRQVILAEIMCLANKMRKEVVCSEITRPINVFTKWEQ